MLLMTFGTTLVILKWSLYKYILAVYTGLLSSTIWFFFIFGSFGHSNKFLDKMSCYWMLKKSVPWSCLSLSLTFSLILFFSEVTALSALYKTCWWTHPSLTVPQIKSRGLLSTILWVCNMACCQCQCSGRINSGASQAHPYRKLWSESKYLDRQIF